MFFGRIEREKGIDKEVLISAVECALVSAAKKVIDLKPGQELKVEIDRSNGKIKAICDGRSITSIDFGRIAAQTAAGGLGCSLLVIRSRLPFVAPTTQYVGCEVGSRVLVSRAPFHRFSSIS